MDILSLIRKKSQILQAHEKFLGLDAVVTHIETAEKYLVRGKDEKDDNFYTDVIYRTNHAFEGILKEAYTVFTEKNDAKVTPFEIENYLANNSTLKQRVKDLFTNYRQEWRNPSTHDYQLFFTEQEAFLAIVSVSAFVNILLDQMIEQVNFKLEKERVKKYAQEIKERIEKYNSRELLDKVTQLLLAFSDELIKSMPATPKNEAELLGMLSGFISSVDKNIQANTQTIRLGTRIFEPDLSFTSGKENVIIEVKSAHYMKQNKIRAQNQLLSYLRLIPEASNGVLFFVPTEKDAVMVVENEEAEMELGVKAHLAIIYPRKNSAG
jgi:hypothetical protein